MASPLDAEVGPGVNEYNDLLSKFRAAKPYAQCCENIIFFAVTVLTVSDLVTDIWLIVDYGQRRHIVFLAVGVMSLLVCHFGAATMYAIQMKSEGNHNFVRLYGCLLLNFPCHVGIIAHRLNHNCRNCESCFDPSESTDMAVTSQKTNTNWKFAKIKLIQCMLQCVPQLILNLVHMYIYNHQVSSLQCISGSLSFLSLLLGITLYEKCRREQIRGCTVSFLIFSCIFTYETFLLGSRILAISTFVFMYGAWASAILAPHFAMVLILFFYLYRSIWPIPYYKICLHSVYGIVSYFPIHGEYRPDGEIIMCYSLYILENILMACLPYGITPTMDIPPHLQPKSKQYIIISSIIVAASALGTTFLVLYNCFLDFPYSSISSEREGCFSRLCSCCKRGEVSSRHPPSSLNITNSIYINDSHEPGSSKSSKKRKQKIKAIIDSSYLSTQTGAGPPRYRTLSSKGNVTPPELNDSPTHPVLPTTIQEQESVQLMSPGSVLGINGMLVITPEGDCGRPSILEGDDNSEAEMINDSDKIPLHP